MAVSFICHLSLVRLVVRASGMALPTSAVHPCTTAEIWLREDAPLSSKSDERVCASLPSSVPGFSDQGLLTNDK